MLKNREYPDEQHWRLARVVGAINCLVLIRLSPTGNYEFAGEEVMSMSSSDFQKGLSA